MRTVRLRHEMTEAAHRPMVGKAITAAHVRTVLTEDTMVLRPDGTLLCALVRGGIPAELCDAAYPALHSLRNQVTDNRGNYSGGERLLHKRQDGLTSRQNKTYNPDGTLLKVRSAVIGMYDRYPRIPFCRQTAFTAQHVAAWHTVLPMLAAAGHVMRAHAPNRWRAQMDAVRKVHPDFQVQHEGEPLPFTTFTINNNVQSSVHTDKGDYAPGIGVISVLRKGTYSGLVLAMSRYGVGADLHHGDVFLFDAHEWHANTPMEPGASADAERITVVHYLRAKMLDCGSAAEERQRAAAWNTELQARKLRGEVPT